MTTNRRCSWQWQYQKLTKQRAVTATWTTTHAVIHKQLQQTEMAHATVKAQQYSTTAGQGTYASKALSFSSQSTVTDVLQCANMTCTDAWLTESPETA